MMEILLEVQHLTIAYPQNREVVRGLNLCLKKGERLGIVGESGAGKTTLAMALAGINNQEQTRSGTVTFYGKQRGIILQNAMTCLDPLMKIKDQLKEVLCKSRNCSKKEAYGQAEELLEEVGICPAKQYMGSYPFMCSGGMQQRINLAMALAADPDLLIADEPTTALDVTIQAQVLAMIGELKEKLETSMLLITHDLGVVAQTCDKVAIMYAGEIIEYGSVEDIFGDRPHHPYTVGLFGSIPDLTVDTDRLKPIAGLMPDPTDLPEGCKFHPRCPHCQEQCKTTRPPVIEKDGHLIQCHLFAKEEEAGV